jgi:predicted DNA-binding antitoxin AbrB/MazE fold protein
MSITFDAVYEDGVLKPVSPLPLKEHVRVRATLEPQDSNGTRWQPLIECKDAALIEQAALDPELEF